MDIVERAKRAVWQQFVSQSEFKIDDKGYVAEPWMNLLPGITMDSFESELDDGSGSELEGKFLAVHSSSALAVNAFAIWKKDFSNLSLCGKTEFTELEFEKKCSTGLGGTPPHLDVFLENRSTVVGIESKFLETLKPKKPHFASSYNRDNLPQIENEWWELLLEVSEGEPQYLDVAQLIKHYLGLRNGWRGEKEIILLYLFWEPENAAHFVEFRRHREELAYFESRVRDSSVAFVGKSYPELWREWKAIQGTKDHVRNLRRRYSLKILPKKEEA